MTSIDGLYAISDVVSALNQISVAEGHAAVAAIVGVLELNENGRCPRARCLPGSGAMAWPTCIEANASGDGIRAWLAFQVRPLALADQAFELSLDAMEVGQWPVISSCYAVGD